MAVSRAEETWVGFAFFQVMTEEGKLFLGCDEKPSFLVGRGCSCDIQRGVARDAVVENVILGQNGSTVPEVKSDGGFGQIRQRRSASEGGATGLGGIKMGV